MSDQEDYDLNDEEEVQEEDKLDNAEGEEEQQNEDNDKDKEGEEEKLEEEDEEEKPPDMPLNEEIMAESLQLLCKTGNGLAHAYVRLDAAQKELTDISILKNFIHLRYIDLSNNNLKDISALNVLTHLLTLKLDYNKLTSAKLEPLPYLQQASFSNNKIKNTDGIAHPKLELLNLNKNEIEDIRGFEHDKLPNLQTLEIRDNKLKSTKGIRLPNLKSLFIAANAITSLEDLSELRSLTVLHARDNKIEKLDGFGEKMTSLQYINLRGNLIHDFVEVKKLQVLPKLTALVLLDTPLVENGEYRLEVLISVRRLDRLDKDQYSEEDRTDAEEIANQRLLQQKQKEEEEANNAESEAAKGNKNDDETEKLEDLENSKIEDE